MLVGATRESSQRSIIEVLVRSANELAIKNDRTLLHEALAARKLNRPHTSAAEATDDR
jgi:hypothetical protein